MKCLYYLAPTLNETHRISDDLHEAGVDHVDLNLKNILLAPDGRAIVIDLDRCRISDHALPWPTRRRNPGCSRQANAASASPPRTALRSTSTRRGTVRRPNSS